MNVSASVAVPTVTHAPVSTVGLTEKVSIRNLDFYYGASKALKSINIPLYENKVTAFIGPSGCGKSTLLRVLNRMYDLYPNQRAEGEVEFDGEDILSPKQDLNLLRARIGMVFQKPTPFPMSIYENIAFGIGCTRSCRSRSSTSGWKPRCAGPRSGTRSRASLPPTG